MDNAKQIVFYFFERTYNQRDLEYVMKYFADDYYEHTATGARPNAQAVNILRGAFDTFPDLHASVEDIIAQADLVAVRVAFTGTQRGEFAGAPPSGRKLTWEGMEFFRVSRGKISESWGAWPTYDMLREINR